MKFHAYSGFIPLSCLHDYPTYTRYEFHAGMRFHAYLRGRHEISCRHEMHCHVIIKSHSHLHLTSSFSFSSLSTYMTSDKIVALSFIFHKICWCYIGLLKFLKYDVTLRHPYHITKHFLAFE